MKCKIIPYFLSINNTNSLEEEINEWLSEHPNITTETVTSIQNTINGTITSIGIIIFYKEA